MTRADGRRRDELRPLEIVPGFLEQADGSALITLGRTRVLCTATAEDGVPRWLEGRGQGWLTAEYGMLPASTGERMRREASAVRQKGRTVEIQRLIGRSIRGAYDLANLGERTVWLDCDVLQADGGTRTAAVTGAWVALTLAARARGFTEPPEPIAAVSLGIVDRELLLDDGLRPDHRHPGDRRAGAVPARDAGRARRARRRRDRDDRRGPATSG